MGWLERMRYRIATFLFNLNKRRIFRKPTLNGLYTPFGSPVSGQKPSLPLKKGVLKSSRPSFLIKRAALGNLKASFHCTHWHRFFPLKKAPPFSPSLSSIVFTTPSVPLIGDRNPQGREDVTALQCWIFYLSALRLADQSGLRHILRDGTAGGGKFIIYNL